MLFSFVAFLISFANAESPSLTCIDFTTQQSDRGLTAGSSSLAATACYRMSKMGWVLEHVQPTEQTVIFTADTVVSL